MEMIDLMHVVFVSSLLPVEKPVSGFDIANQVILNAVRAQGIKVSLLGYRTPGSQLVTADNVVLLGEQEITTARAPLGDKIKWLATALANRTTVSSAKMLACGQAKIESALDSLAPFDALILNSVQLPGAFMPVFSKYPSIFIAHNVEAMTAAENAKYAPRFIERLLYRREARLFAGLEQLLCLSSRFVWTLSDEDRETLRVADDNKSVTLPLVTQTQPPSINGSGRNLRYDLGMIGTWSWRPNRIGLDWFMNSVAPKLPEDVSIAIAGNLPGPPGRLTHPGIRLVGRVPDARAFLESCAVVPLASRAGTGVQLKTIEAFEMGLPSVATPSALRGVKTVPLNCTVAKDSDAFAAALADAVKTARQNAAATLDGRPFHDSQIKGLAESIARGLVRLDGQGVGIPKVGVPA